MLKINFPHENLASETFILLSELFQEQFLEIPLSFIKFYGV